MISIPQILRPHFFGIPLGWLAFASLILGSEFGVKAQQERTELQELQSQFELNDDLLQRIIRLSNNAPLLRELEIAGDQSSQLRQFAIDHIRSIKRLKSNSFQLQIRELSGNLSDLETQRLQAEKKANVRQMIEASQASLNKLNSILLKHQVKRLKQISLQQRKIETNRFADEFGMVLELKTELGLSKELSQKLERQIESIRTEYYDALAQLRKKAAARILKELTTSQREIYQELIGPHYDFEAARRDAMIQAQPKRVLDKK